MNKRFVPVLAAAVSIGVATGCTTTQRTMMPGSIVASNKPVEQGKYTVLNGGKPVTGKYTFDLLRSNNDVSGSAMKKAIDQALSQCPGADAMVGITIDNMTTQKTLIFLAPIPLELSFTTFVTGIPVKTQD